MPLARAGSGATHALACSYASAGYYARYAALRGLILQFLATGLAPAARHSNTAAPDAELGSACGGQPAAAGAAAAAAAAAAAPCEHGAAPLEQEQQQQQPLRQRQVLSLGAGYDTAFFQLASEGLAPSKWVELDFQDVTARKAGAILHVPELLACVGGPEAAAAVDAGAARYRCRALQVPPLPGSQCPTLRACAACPPQSMGRW